MESKKSYFLREIKFSRWIFNVFVNPTSQTLLIVFATLVILVVLGTVIVYLHRKEKVFIFFNTH